MGKDKIERIDFDEYQDMEIYNRDNLEEGEKVVLDWDPYRWASEVEGYVDRCYVEVIEVHDGSGDIKLEMEDGRVLIDLGEKRSQVMGFAENKEDVPDYTDVGLNATYYKKE